MVPFQIDNTYLSCIDTALLTMPWQCFPCHSSTQPDKGHMLELLCTTNPNLIT